MKKFVIAVIVASFACAPAAWAYNVQEEEVMIAQPAPADELQTSLNRLTNKVGKMGKTQKDELKALGSKLDAASEASAALAQKTDGLADQTKQNKAAIQNLDTSVKSFALGVEKKMWLLIVLLLVVGAIIAFMVRRAGQLTRQHLDNGFSAFSFRMDRVETAVNNLPGAVKAELAKLEQIELTFNVGKRTFTFSPRIVEVGNKQMYESLYVPKEIRGEQEPEAIVQVPYETSGKLFRSTMSVLASYVDFQYDGNDEHSKKQKFVIECAKRTGALKEVK